jgi:hypothetical protein
MHNHNIIDISGLTSQNRSLALDFIEFLKFKSKKTINSNGNFDKRKLLSAFEQARNPEIFKKIEDSVSWQKELRDEWE